jgi:hypothetical protein
VAPISLPQYTITNSYSLLYFYLISEYFKEGRQILPIDIYLFWEYNSTKASTVCTTKLPVSKPILEPAKVYSKGWPKGSKGVSSKGNSKNNRSTGMSLK